MSEKRYSFAQMLTFVVSVSIILGAVDVAAAWLSKGIDIARTPARQTIDEQNFQNFKDDTQQNFQRIFQKLDHIESGITNHIIQI